MEAWEAVLDTAIENEYIKDRELNFVPDLLPTEERLLGAMREALPVQMEALDQQQLTFPIVRNLFVYTFIRGVEAAYHFNQPFNHPYDIQLTDMVAGYVKVDVSEDIAEYANSRPIPDDLFSAFQDWALENKEQIETEKMDLEGEIFRSLQWVFRIGVSVAMEFEG